VHLSLSGGMYHVIGAGNLEKHAIHNQGCVVRAREMAMVQHVGERCAFSTMNLLI
jgi:hypothetical protein